MVENQVLPSNSFSRRCSVKSEELKIFKYFIVINMVRVSMRVWHFSPQFPPFIGGQEKGVFNFITYLSKVPQLEITVFTTTPKADLITKNVTFRVLRVPGIHCRLGTFSIVILTFLKELYHFKKPEIIHIHFPDPFFILPIALIAKILKIPIILHVHLWYKQISKSGQFIVPIIKRVFCCPLVHISEFLLSPNVYTCKKIIYYCRKQQDYRVIPYGLVHKPKILSNDRFKNQKNKILYIGRINHQKRLDRLVNSLKLIPKGKRPYIDVYGGGEDFKKIKDLIKTLKLSDWIKLKGSIPFKSVTQVYSNPEYKFFILPSDAEAYPNVIIESLSHGLPVLATNIKELTTVYKGNILFSEPSPNGFAEKIVELLGNYGILRKFRSKGYEYLNFHPSWKESSKRILQVYKTVYQRYYYPKFRKIRK